MSASEPSNTPIAFLGRILTRLVSLLVAAVALGVAGITFWLVYDLLFHSPDAPSTPADRLAFAYLLALAGLGVAILGLRLAFPRFRVEGDRLLSARTVSMVLGIYVVGFLVAMVLKTPQAQITCLAIVLGALIPIAWRSSFGPKG